VAHPSEGCPSNPAEHRTGSAQMALQRGQGPGRGAIVRAFGCVLESAEDHRAGPQSIGRGRPMPWRVSRPGGQSCGLDVARQRFVRLLHD
jgi:hypothetical protein